MTDREVMQIVLDALLYDPYFNDCEERLDEAIDVLRTALGHPESNTDIERYRVQLAAISTAALGYWKEDQDILPEYETVALHDVAKLYEKYESLLEFNICKEEIVAGAIFDFAGYLTTREKVIRVGSSAEASPMVDLITEWAKIRNLSIKEAKVKDWNRFIKPIDEIFTLNQVLICKTTKESVKVVYGNDGSTLKLDNGNIGLQWSETVYSEHSINYIKENFYI